MRIRIHRLAVVRRIEPRRRRVRPRRQPVDAERLVLDRSQASPSHPMVGAPSSSTSRSSEAK
jgi:hypothetical protein